MVIVRDRHSSPSPSSPILPQFIPPPLPTPVFFFNSLPLPPHFLPPGFFLWQPMSPSADKRTLWSQIPSPINDEMITLLLMMMDKMSPEICFDGPLGE